MNEQKKTLIVFPEQTNVFSNFSPVERLFGSQSHFSPHPLLLWGGMEKLRHPVLLWDANVEHDFPDSRIVENVVCLHKSAHPHSLDAWRDWSDKHDVPFESVCFDNCEMSPELLGVSPLYNGVSLGKYGSLSINRTGNICNFCDFSSVSVKGLTHRARSNSQILNDLDVMLKLSGGKKSVYITDNDLLGNLDDPDNLDEISLFFSDLFKWQEKNSYPFDFFVRCGLKLADHSDLQQNMLKSGASILFLEIDLDRPIDLSVKGVVKLREKGFGMFAGMHSSNDKRDEVIERQKDFVSKSSVPIISIMDSRALSELDAKKQYALWYNPEEYYKRSFAWISSWNDSMVIGGKRGSTAENFKPGRVLKNFMVQLEPDVAPSFIKYLLKSSVTFFFKPMKMALTLYLSYLYPVVGNKAGRR